ncbi:hypothetical protein Zmor_000632 [Zophobas morio]|uniref:Uncharacterized protein n=1 Tax=Zophobas morio TaxID=2755281 RepID=A0AA38J1P9_9CUCU|nr:hypothetical protein Zmor_000632 [Zophobas morio]
MDNSATKEDQAPILLRASPNPIFVAKKHTKAKENETPEPVTIFKVPATRPPPTTTTINQELTTQQHENSLQDIHMDVSAASEFPLPEGRSGEFINSDELSRKRRFSTTKNNK